ncbi:hypothetical protein M9H77_24098 [Catharanthus roseus]|uniref:Uncharacterized protein n=1 Tax=Catharanthus roseus TaxID=4058 RepID=A0ACC0AWX1_CATRO|nr:hypothetical protein M9H77_24098 [Catharanthus roseus]
MALTLKDADLEYDRQIMAIAKNLATGTKGGTGKEEEEEEDELFEIDFEAVNKMATQPTYCWDWEISSSYVTSNTSTTLLANCLLPISDVSSAVPTTTTVAKANRDIHSFSWPTNSLFVAGFPSFGVSSLRYKETKA